VHYHAGLFDEPEVLDASSQVLKKQIIASQERILQYTAQVWHASSTLRGEILDIGCGLGGGSLFWAQEFGARVAAVTCAPSHAQWVAHFAAQAGVASHVQPFVCNAVEMPGENCFDAAVAIESSCHMPRQALFQRLATLLRPGGWVFIADFFFEQPKYEEISRQHWYAPIGTFREYYTAAKDVGFQEEFTEDISHRTEHFWAMTTALIQAEASQMSQSATTAKKIEESIQAHTLVQKGLASGGMRYALMAFKKNNN
jgi:cyclopropane fatty-acyl-phospholipid synthase-like methyltransferase